jgi:hypothetical protein
MTRVHQRFDPERWIAEFPLERKRREVRAWVEKNEREHPGTYKDAAAMEAHARLMGPDGDIIVGPASMAYAEQLRREFDDAATLGPGVPVDMMVWAMGFPEQPAATKIGGVPFRSKGADWPRGRSGEASEFIAQICFADSKDILRDRRGRVVETPREVLLIFSPDPSGIWDSDEDDPTCLQHEWWSLGEQDLITAADVPEGGSNLEPCYAELHRTMDYPARPDSHPLLSIRGGEKVCVLEGGKIGGVPSYVQGADPRPGPFVATLGSVNPVGARFPLINVPVNPSGEFNMEGGFLMFGDCGSLYLFISVEGVLRKRARLHWTVQGY